MTISTLRIALLVLTTAAAGCATTMIDDTDTSGSNLSSTRLTSALERKLREPVDVPTGTVIGRSMDSAVAERTGSLRSLPLQSFLVSAGSGTITCTVQHFVDAQGTSMMHREKCGDSDILRVQRAGERTSIAIADFNRDGRVDAFTDWSGPTFELHDEDYDGRVDRVIEAAERLSPPVALEAFGDGIEIVENGKIANRIREDADKDGRFESEMITATTMFKRTVSE